MVDEIRFAERSTGCSYRLRWRLDRFTSGELVGSKRLCEKDGRGTGFGDSIFHRILPWKNSGIRGGRGSEASVARGVCASCEDQSSGETQRGVFEGSGCS